MAQRLPVLWQAAFRSLDALKDASEEALLEVDEIGPIIVQSLKEHLSNDRNLSVVEKLRQAGMAIESEAREASGEPRLLEGLTIVVTGTLERWGRTEIQEVIRKHGGKTTSSISKKTNLVVAGEAAGSKKTKAEALKIEILDEQGFAKPDWIDLGGRCPVSQLETEN